MFKINLYRSPDKVEGGGENNEDPFAGYENQVEGEIAGKPAGEKVEPETVISEEEKKELAAVATDKDIVRKDENKGSEGAEGDKGGKGKEGEEGEDGKEASDEFTLDDLEKVEDLPAPEDETYNWKDIGSEIGITIEEDNPEALKKGVEEFVFLKQKEAIAEYLEKEKGYSQEALRYIDALNAGATEIEIIENQSAYIDFLAMSPEDKIIEQGKASGLSEEKAKERYESLIEDGKLEETISSIDKAVRTQMVASRQKLLESYQQIADQKRADDQAALKRENDLILKALSERTEFNGKKLTPEVKKQLAARWNAGIYRKAFETSPNDVVDFVLNKELGKKVVTDRIAEAEQNAKKTVHAKLRNLDTAKEGQRNASQQPKPKQGLDPSNPFEGYEGLKDDADYRISYGG